jgi:hypothetical protein
VPDLPTIGRRIVAAARVTVGAVRRMRKFAARARKIPCPRFVGPHARQIADAITNDRLNLLTGDGTPA